MRSSIGSILQIAPLPSGSVIEPRRRQRQTVALLVRCAQPAARREHDSQIVGQPLIHPQQIVLHRLLIVSRRQIRRSTVLPIPRMHILMGQQPCLQLTRIFVH